MALLRSVVKDPTAFFANPAPPPSSDWLPLLVAFTMLVVFLRLCVSCLTEYSYFSPKYEVFLNPTKQFWFR